MNRKLTHTDAAGNPMIVDVSGKKSSLRVAHAQARVWLGPVIVAKLKKDEIATKKGPVFHTAVIAGIMAAKKTSDLIPLCHPVGLDDCTIDISVAGAYAVIKSSASVTARTGVEMEALTAATVAALTIYDMCKAMSHDIRIEEIQLMSKTGGKKDFIRRLR